LICLRRSTAMLTAMASMVNTHTILTDTEADTEHTAMDMEVTLKAITETLMTHL